MNRKMNVLGLHIGHDSSTVLIKDGKLLADVAEERFSRIKHYNGIPYAGIEYCLQEGKLSAGDIDVVAVSSKFPVPGLNFLLDRKSTRLNSSHGYISYAVFCLKKKKKRKNNTKARVRTERCNTH